MERGNLVILSGRVPLMGEMVRLEIDQDSALLVNKYDKTYAKVSTASLLNRIGVNLTDFQDLLLGRVFLAGSAPLSRDNVSLFQVSAAVGGNYIVTPKVQRNDCEYGFTLYPDGKMFLAAAFTTDDKYLLQSEYSYIKDKTALEISATVGKKAYGGTLTLSAPNYSPKPLERIKVNSAWKRTTLKGLFEALK